MDDSEAQLGYKLLFIIRSKRLVCGVEGDGLGVDLPPPTLGPAIGNAFLMIFWNHQATMGFGWYAHL